MIRKYLSRYSLIVFALILALPISAYANTGNRKVFDVVFYNPNAKTLDCGPSGNIPMTGEDNLQKIYNYFLGKGTSKKAAAAVVGNISQESGGNPLLVQGGGYSSDPGSIGLYRDGSRFENKPGQRSVGRAWGILQWDPGNAVLYWQKQAGVEGDITLLEKQLELAWWHLNNLAPTSKKNVLASMEAAGDVAEATRIMTDRYFGPSKPHYDNRIKAAVKAMSYPTDPSLAVVEDSSACAYDGAPIEEGGLTEDQAKKFVMNYGENKNDSTRQILLPGNYWSGRGGYNYGANCVSFTVFFLRKFTKSEYAGGDGAVSVANMRAAGVPTGTEPKVGAVFSWSGGTYGHTGIVLGIHGDEIITGMASYSSGGKGPGDGVTEGNGVAFIRKGKLNEPRTWGWNSNPTPSGFAYPEGIDLDAVAKYLQTGI